MTTRKNASTSDVAKAAKKSFFNREFYCTASLLLEAMAGAFIIGFNVGIATWAIGGLL